MWPILCWTHGSFECKNTELLCRAVEFGLTFDQLQGAELSCFELLALRLQVLEMKHRDKVPGSLLGDLSRRTVAFILAWDAHVDIS